VSVKKEEHTTAIENTAQSASDRDTTILVVHINELQYNVTSNFHKIFYYRGN
jgi:hypothetical protein